MLYFSSTKKIFLLGICILIAFLALPNFLNQDSNIPFVPNKTVNLGLDLRGGSYLLLEVDTETIRKEKVDTIVDDIRSTLRKNQIQYSNLSSLENGAKVYILKEEEVRTAIDLIKDLNQTQNNLIFSGQGIQDFELSNDKGNLVLDITEQSMKEKNRLAVTQSIEIIRRRIDGLGVTEPSIQRQGEKRILLEVPGLDNPQRLKDLLGQTAKLNFRMVDTSISASEAIRTRVPSRSEVLYDKDLVPWLVNKKILVSGERLSDAQAGFDQMTNSPVVNFRFDVVGGKAFARATSKNVSKPFAIVLDDEVISAPTIREPILGGSGQIEGGFSVEEANDLAILLRAGALPAPLSILEERTIGPGLGADSINSGKIATIVGMILVLLFIFISYGRFGLYANVALTLNIIFIIGILSLLQATLTLPGIAGIVLTVGMAVDANVIIFERIREEYNNGKTPFSSVESGYSRALGTILDANVTTLIASVILFFLGTGPVKGFAVTLTIGIVTSFFTAFVITRLIISQWLLRRKPEELPI